MQFTFLISNISLHFSHQGPTKLLLVLLSSFSISAIACTFNSSLSMYVKILTLVGSEIYNQVLNDYCAYVHSP